MLVGGWSVPTLEGVPVPEPKTCASCGRTIEWRKKWARSWDEVQYCSDAVWGFFEEMKRLGKQDEVAILVHSEFGRRVPENTGLGTDHGTANVSFVMGGGVTGGQYSTPPSLTELVHGDNLQHTTDFRRVYATLIEEYLGSSKSETALGRKFQTLGMFT